jgi:hypothetical protein
MNESAHGRGPNGKTVTHNRSYAGAGPPFRYDARRADRGPPPADPAPAPTNPPPLASVRYDVDQLGRPDYHLSDATPA